MRLGVADLAEDPRFSDPAKLAANMKELTAIVDEDLPLAADGALARGLRSAHITYGEVRDPVDVVRDPQLRENGIVVPLEGAGGKLTETVSSPIQVHGVDKVPAKRAPGLGEHNEEILTQLGFDRTQIASFVESGAVRATKNRPAAA